MVWSWSSPVPSRVWASGVWRAAPLSRMAASLPVAAGRPDACPSESWPALLPVVQVVQGAVEQAGQDVDPDLVQGGGVPGAAGGVGEQVDPFDRGLGLRRGEAAGVQHGGAVLVQPRAHRAVAQGLAVAALVVPRIDPRHQAAQPHHELARGEPTGDRQQHLADGRDLCGGEPGEVVGEHRGLGPVEVAGEERRVHLGKVVHELLGEVALPVGGAPRPRQGGADLVGGVRDRVVEPVDRGVVESRHGPVDVGDHPEQPGRLVAGLPRLRDQEWKQVVVGHPRGVDPGQGGGEHRTGGMPARAATPSTSTAMTRT
jgi:hypothetical protein